MKIRKFIQTSAVVTLVAAVCAVSVTSWTKASSRTWAGVYEYEFYRFMQGPEPKCVYTLVVKADGRRLTGNLLLQTGLLQELRPCSLHVRGAELRVLSDLAGTPRFQFSLRHAGDQLITHWGSLIPQYPDPKDGVYFTRIAAADVASL